MEFENFEVLFLNRVGYDKDSIQRMLKEMTVIKDKFVVARNNIDAGIKAWGKIKSPLSELEGLYEGVQAWCEESEEIMEGFEDPNCGMVLEKIKNLHRDQFGEDVHKELENNIERMKNLINDINAILFGGMTSEQINNRVVSLVKRVMQLKQNSMQWGNTLDEIERKWDKESV